jgi:hypothetical protein
MVKKLLPLQLQIFIIYHHTNNDLIHFLIFIAKEGEFRWSSTGKVGSYTNWHPHQPDNLNNQDCANLWNVNGIIKWDDAPCTHTGRFICEMSKSVSNTVQIIKIQTCNDVI